MMNEKRRSSDVGTPRGISTYSVISQPLGNRREVNSAVYALLFSEIVQYCRSRVQSTTALEQKLSEIGYRIGRRSLELVAIRDKAFKDKASKRENTLRGILSFVMTTLWKFLFGKQADGLKKVNESEGFYYIEERAPLVNTYVSIPKDYGSMNCAAFVAGIIAGVLNSSGFPAKVNAYSQNNQAGVVYPPLTIYYIVFEEDVLSRENRVRA